jgi:hypothetical protein
MRTLAREQASQEALIFRGFGAPFGRVAMVVASGIECMVSNGGDGDC